jgi:hypothetical protein
MILVAAAAAATPVDAALRPWTIDETIRVPEPELRSQFESDTGTLIDAAREIARDTHGALPNTASVWMAEGEPGEAPRMHYRVRDLDGVVRERLWPRASDGSLDFLGTWSAQGARLVVARAGSQVLIVWVDELSVTARCELDTGQLAHADAGTYRMSITGTPPDAAIYLLPIGAEGIDVGQAGFRIATNAPPRVPARVSGSPAPPCTVQRVEAAGATIVAEPAFVPVAPQAHPALSLGTTVLAAIGVYGPRVDTWVEGWSGRYYGAVGYGFGDRGVSGRWSARAGLRFEDGRGSTAVGPELREHQYTEWAVPGVWADRTVDLGRVQISADTEAVFTQSTPFAASLRVDQQLGVGLHLGGVDRELLLAAVGGVGVTGRGEWDAWGGARVSASMPFSRPDWAHRAALLTETARGGPR